MSQALLLISFAPFYDFQGVVIELVTDAMLRHPDSPGFLIDGFPRKLSQGEQFEEEASIVLFIAYKNQQQRNREAFFSPKSIPIAHIHVSVTGLIITAGQNDHLSRQCSAGHFDRTRKQATREHFMFLLVRLIRLSCYGVIFHIVTSQKKEVTELKFLWPDNTTRNNCKFSLIPVSGLSSFSHFTSKPPL